MKRFLTGLLLFTVSLLQADFNPELSTIQLPDTDGKTALVQDGGFPVGTTGIVLHAFDDKHKTIVAEAVVVGKKDGKLEVRFRKFRRLHQAALPEYKIVPQKGDMLVLNYLYNRVLPVTPDEAHYRSFRQTYGAALDIIHPDLFASQLYLDHEPRPGKKDFRKICYTQDTSLLYFAIENSGYFVDCNTFAILDKAPLTTPADRRNAQKPFYNRMPQIKNRLGGIIGGEGIRDYNRYYKQLLGIK